VNSVNPQLGEFETSCFDGKYITGDITPEYLEAIESSRAVGKSSASDDDASSEFIDLNLNVAEQNLI